MVAFAAPAAPLPPLCHLTMITTQGIELHRLEYERRRGCVCFRPPPGIRTACLLPANLFGLLACVCLPPGATRPPRHPANLATPAGQALRALAQRSRREASRHAMPRLTNRPACDRILSRIRTPPSPPPFVSSTLEQRRPQPAACPTAPTSACAADSASAQGTSLGPDSAWPGRLTG
jgi:hypothetical protein